MPSTTFRSESRLRNPGLIALLGLMTLLLIYHILVVLIVRPTTFDAGVTLLIAALIGLGWYAVARSRMKIKISKKYLKLRVKGLVSRRLKLPVKEIADCTFVDVPAASRWSGSLTHPAGDFRNFDFGGRGGVCIQMRDGRSYFISCDELFARRHDTSLQGLAHAS